MMAALKGASADGEYPTLATEDAEASGAEATKSELQAAVAAQVEKAQKVPWCSASGLVTLS
jgi:hypothetical protein